jgi:hypothetical protein
MMNIAGHFETAPACFPRLPFARTCVDSFCVLAMLVEMPQALIQKFTRHTSGPGSATHGSCV